MDVVAKALAAPESISSPCLVVPIFSASTTAKSKSAGSQLSKTAKQIDKAAGGIIQRMVSRGDGKGELGTTLLLPAVTGIKAERLLLLGCGNGKALSATDFKKLVTACLSTLERSHITNASVLLEELTVADQDTAWMAAQFALTAGSNSYRYSKTLSKAKPAASLKRITYNAAPMPTFVTPLLKPKLLLKE